MALLALNKKKTENRIKNKPATPDWNPWSVQPGQVLAPTSGLVKPVGQSVDEIFASGQAGTGVVMEPEGSLICAPVSGKILMVFPTNSSVSIEDEQGRELLIHVGMGTSRMKPSPFTAFVKPGDHVQAGQPLLEVRWNLIDKEGLSRETAIVLPGKNKIADIHTGYADASESLFHIAAR